MSDSFGLLILHYLVFPSASFLYFLPPPPYFLLNNQLSPSAELNNWYIRKHWLAFGKVETFNNNKSQNLYFEQLRIPEVYLDWFHKQDFG